MVLIAQLMAVDILQSAREPSLSVPPATLQRTYPVMAGGSSPKKPYLASSWFAGSFDSACNVDMFTSDGSSCG